MAKPIDFSQAFGAGAKAAGSSSSRASSKGKIDFSEAFGGGGAAAESSGGGGGFLGGILAGGGNAVVKAFDIADQGRAAIASGVIEAGDGLRALAGKDPYGSTDQIVDRGFSLQDFKDNFNNRVGGRDILDSEKSTEDLNPWVKTGLGFVADMTLDPLSYVTFGATAPTVAAGKKLAHRSGLIVQKNEVARKLLDMDKAAIERLGGRETVESMATNVLRRGGAQMSGAAADEIGLKVGAQFAGHVIPGTQKIGKAASNVLGGTGSLLRQGITKTIPTETWRKIERIPGYGEIFNSPKHGPIAALRYADSVVNARTASRRWGYQALNSLSEIVSKNEDANWDGIRQAIESGTVDSLQASDRQVAVALKDQLEDMRVSFNKETGFDLPKLEDYFPHQVTQEFREQILAKRGKVKGKPSSPTMRRELWERGDGEAKTFLGVDVKNGDIDELHLIAKEVLGDEAVEMFLTDPSQVFLAYTYAMQRQMEHGLFVNQLEKFGLAQQFDKAGAKALRKTARKNTKEANKAVARARTARADARTATRDASIARAVAQDSYGLVHGNKGTVQMDPEVRALLDSIEVESAEIGDVTGAIDSRLNDIETGAVVDEPVQRPDAPLDTALADEATAAREAAEADLKTAWDESAVVDSKFADTPLVQSTTADDSAVRALEAEREQIVARLEQQVPGEDLAELTKREAQLSEQLDGQIEARKPLQNKVRSIDRTLRGDLKSGTVNLGDEATISRPRARSMERDQFEALDVEGQVQATREAIANAEDFSGQKGLLKKLDRIDELQAEIAQKRAVVANSTHGVDDEMAETISMWESWLKAGVDDLGEKVDRKILRREIADAKKGLDRGGMVSMGTVTKGIGERGTRKGIKSESAGGTGALEEELAEKLDSMFGWYSMGVENTLVDKRLVDDFRRAKAEGGTLTDESVEEVQAKRAKAVERREEANASINKVRSELRITQDKIKKLQKSDAQGKVIEGSTTKVQVDESQLAKVDAELDQARKELADARIADKGVAANKAKVAKILKEKAVMQKRVATATKILEEAKRVELDHWNDLNSLQTVDQLDDGVLQEALDLEYNQLVEELETLSGRRKQLGEEKASLLADARKAAEAGGQYRVSNENILRQAAEVEAIAFQARANAVTSMNEAAAAWSMPRSIDKAMSDKLREISNEQLRGFATRNNMWGDKEIVDAANSLFELSKPQSLNKFMRVHDMFLSRWKAYALLSPGYHARNTQTAFYMNALAGMDVKHYGTFIRFSYLAKKHGGDVSAAMKSIKSPKLREAYATMIEWNGMLGGKDAIEAVQESATQYGRRRGIAGGAEGSLRRTLDPTSMDNAAFKTNFWVAGKVEHSVRAPLFIDGLMKGMSPEDAYQRVVLHHFDYEDLSYVEKRYLKRIVPFYTWQRKNFPVMMNYMIHKPAAVNVYTNAKRNLEYGVPEDEITPDYYEEIGAIRTPWSNKGGDKRYLIPDLPFLAVNDQLDVNQGLASMSPIIKTPIEVFGSKQFFKGLPLRDGMVKTPDPWGPFMQVLSVADGKLGLPKPIKQGNTWLISEKDAYKFEQAWPLAGRVRRLGGAEEKYNKRQYTTLMSLIFGVGMRTNTEDEQNNELFRRKLAVQAKSKRENAIAKALGEE